LDGARASRQRRTCSRRSFFFHQAACARLYSVSISLFHLGPKPGRDHPNSITCCFYGNLVQSWIRREARWQNARTQYGEELMIWLICRTGAVSGIHFRFRIAAPAFRSRRNRSAWMTPERHLTRLPAIVRLLSSSSAGYGHWPQDRLVFWIARCVDEPCLSALLMHAGP